MSFFVSLLSSAGDPVEIARAMGRGNGDWQVDRIDASRGYTPDNVQLLDGYANRVKGNHEKDQDPF